MSTSFPTVRVAAIQATPVVLDAEGCVEKAVGLLHEAADRGAQLAVLPECFIPLYPSNAWAKEAAGFGGWDALWERLWENAVDVPGPLLGPSARLVRVRTEPESEPHCRETPCARPSIAFQSLECVRSSCCLKCYQ